MSDGPHIVFTDTSQHLEQIFYNEANGAWGSGDITGASSAELAAPDSSLTLFMLSDGPHIIFTGANHDLWQIFYNEANGTWGSGDIRGSSSAGSAASGSGLTTFTLSDGPHIVFTDVNQHLEQIFYNGTWDSGDITGASSAGLGAPAGGLSSFLLSDGPHIVFTDVNQHLEQIFYNGTWGSGDITGASGAGVAAPASGLTAFLLSDGPHIVFTDTNQHLEQIFYNGIWGSGDVTAASSAEPAMVLWTISGQVTAGGAGFSDATVSMSGTTAAGTAISRSATTDSNGNYFFSVPAGGSYTVTPSYAGGDTFTPAAQTFSNVSGNQVAQTTTAAGGSSTPPSCMNVTPGYLGTWQLNAAGNIAVTATVSTSVTKVNFLIYDEQSQSLSSAASYNGTLSPSSEVLGYNQYTVTVPISTFEALGSYAVTASVQDSNQHTASCTLANSSFFAIVNDSAESSNLNGHSNTGCGSLTGSWTDQAGIQSGETTDRWDLTQSGNTISGTQIVSLGPSCGSIVWQVSGSILDSTKGTFTLTATNPSVAEDQCGFVSATNVTINPLTVSEPACDTASGTEADTYPPEYGNDSFSTTWNATVSIPSGETSQFDQWGPDGYDNQGLFKGKLTTSTGDSQFSGRRVQESFPVDLGDGCAALDSSNTIGAQHASGTGSNWTVLADSTYTDDWIGYGPAITRYYQTRVGTCSLVAPQQVMSISSNNNQWVQYKVNRLEYDVTPTGVIAKRDTESPTPASGSRAYPQ